MEYWIFTYLWVIAVLPKAVQMCVLSCLCLCLFTDKKSFKYRPGHFADTFLITDCIFFFAVLVSMLSKNHDLTRIVAAFNTGLSYILAVYLFFYYKEKKIDVYKISKIMFRNMMILFLLYIVYLVLGSSGNLSFMNGPLCSDDVINGRHETRFKGYLEYSNLVAYMYLYCFPISLLHAKERWDKIIYFLYKFLMILPVLASNSRTGLICVTIEIIAVVMIDDIRTLGRFIKANKSTVSFIGILSVCMMGCQFKDQIIEKILHIFYARQASSYTRLNLYTQSLKKMIAGSPVFGCGIKDMFYDIPYGSHSTFIGMYYKTGIVGGTIFLLGVICTSIRLWRKKDSSRAVLIFTISFYCLLAISIFEDLDGVNWNITMFLVLFAIEFENRYVSLKLNGRNWRWS